jgi:DNA repair protein RadC
MSIRDWPVADRARARRLGGTIDGAIVTLGVIVNLAMWLNAVAVILVHNHPINFK